MNVLQPTRVLLVDHAPVFGGVEAMLCDLVSAVDRARIELILVADPTSPALDKFRLSGVRVRTIPLGRLEGQPLAGARLIRSGIALASLARREQAALIHTFTARTHVIGAFAARLAGLPLLWRLNDDTLAPPVARLLGGIPWRVIAVSGFLAGRYHFLAAPLTIIPDGVPPSTVTPDPNSNCVTLAARLVRWKGQAVFIRAMAEVARRLPEARAEIVGSPSAVDDRPGPLAGGEGYYRELLALTESLGLSGALTFQPFRDRSTLFAGAALAVHASLLPEPFGRTILEAMAAGLPVIGTRAGAVPEIIDNGVTGRLAPAGDASALADAIVALMCDPERRRAMGEAGRARALEHFSVEQMARRFETAWLEAIG